MYTEYFDNEEGVILFLPEQQITLDMPAKNGKKTVMVQTSKGEAFVMVPSHWSHYTIKEYVIRRLEASEQLLSIHEKLPVYDSAI